MSGIGAVDRLRTPYLVAPALHRAAKVLKPGGAALIKVVQGRLPGTARRPGALRRAAEAQTGSFAWPVNPEPYLLAKDFTIV